MDPWSGLGPLPLPAESSGLLVSHTPRTAAPVVHALALPAAWSLLSAERCPALVHSPSKRPIPAGFLPRPCPLVTVGDPCACCCRGSSWEVPGWRTSPPQPVWNPSPSLPCLVPLTAWTSSLPTLQHLEHVASLRGPGHLYPLLWSHGFLSGWEGQPVAPCPLPQPVTCLPSIAHQSRPFPVAPE